MIDLSPIRTEHHTLAFAEIDGSDQLTAMVIIPATGEVREQTIFRPNTRGWRETAANRMRRLPEHQLTPMFIVPRPRQAR